MSIVPSDTGAGAPGTTIGRHDSSGPELPTWPGLQDLANLLVIVQEHHAITLDSLEDGHPAAETLHLTQKAVARARALCRGMEVAGQVAGETGFCELVSLVRDCVEYSAPLLPAGVRVWHSVPQDSDVWVQVDGVLLLQLLMNLMINAGNAMPDGGFLTVAAEATVQTDPIDALPESLPPGEYARIVVADTGCGIDPLIEQRLFEHGFTTAPDGEGRGEGLSMVLDVLRRCGGGIRLASKRNVGSTFTVFLPRPRVTKLRGVSSSAP